MKHVFTDINEVAHLWANKLQDSAKNSGHNFFFADSTIYSYGYHFPIAAHHNSKFPVVLFTTRTYSVTTAKHIRYVSSACSHLDKIYCYNPLIKSERDHEQNFEAWISQSKNIAHYLKKATKPQKYLSQLENVKNEIDAYAEYFDLAIPEPLAILLSIQNKAEYADYLTKQKEYIAIEKAKKEKELEKKIALELKKFKSFKIDRLYNRHETDYLRFVSESGQVETSQGLTIGHFDSKNLYKALLSDTLKVGDTLLDYSVNQVSDIIKIGCHTFTKKYLLAFGKKHFSIN